MAIHEAPPRPALAVEMDRNEAGEAPDTAGAARTAILEVTPILVGVTPFGLAIGVAISDSAINDAAGWSGSVLLFAGSAHMALVSVLGAGGGVLAALTAVAVVNARLAIYSALLAPPFREQPRWFRWVAPYFLLDQTYVLVSRHIEAARSAVWIRRYYLATGLVVLAVWPPVIAAGVLAGPLIPADWHLSFAVPLLIAGMLAPALRSRTALLVASTAGIVALATAALPGGAALIAGAGAGTAAGYLAERIMR